MGHVKDAPALELRMRNWWERFSHSHLNAKFHEDPGVSERLPDGVVTPSMMRVSLVGELRLAVEDCEIWLDEPARIYALAAKYLAVDLPQRQITIDLAGMICELEEP